MKTRLFGILTTLLLCLALLPMAAAAAPSTTTSVNYIDDKGEEQTCESAITVSSLDYSDAVGGYELKPINGINWYVVNGDTTIDRDVYIQGNVHLILQDGCTLTINGRLRSIENTPSSLTVYRHSDGPGTLSVNYEDSQETVSCAIELDGNLTVNGGTVNVTKGKNNGLAIGIISTGQVAVNGGTVNVDVTHLENEAEGIYAANGLSVSGNANVDIKVTGKSVANGLRTQTGNVSIGGSARVTINATADKDPYGTGAPGKPRGIFCVESDVDVTISDSATLNITGSIKDGYTDCNSIEDIVTRGIVTVANTATVNAIASRGDKIETNVFPEHIQEIYVYGACVAHGITVPAGATMTIQPGASLALNRGSTSHIYGTVASDENKITEKLNDNSANAVIKVYNGADFPLAAVKDCNVQYQITKNLTNLTAQSSNTFAAAATISAAAYEETLIPASGYLLPKSICVTIGGTEFTEHNYDAETGAFSIPNAAVTGPVTITAAGDKVASPPIFIPVIPSEPEVPDVPVDDTCGGGEDCPTNHFTDVDQTQDYHEAIDFVYENGYMVGMSGTEFGTDTTMHRGMIMTILYAMEKDSLEAQAIANTFTDVADDAYYAEAVNWAAQNGICSGYGNGKFGPEDEITIEQLAAFLYRYAEYKGWDITAEGDLSGLDYSAWFETQLKWAIGNEIMDAEWTPKAEAKRWQAAMMLYNFCK